MHEVIEAARVGPNDILVLRMPASTDREGAERFREELAQALGVPITRVVAVFGVDQLTVLSDA